ncbi:MAG: glucose-1-phosphate adenylyltransferase [Gammaproteobacteria bacterium]|nr:MAG: glucose-1-phosphate adenylyltransferase [Gammaproteobacteria bacterium]
MKRYDITNLKTGRALSKETLVLILAGGRGSRLYELTDNRAKPAVYFGGSRRIIDFPLSNCINSNLNHIGVITQYAAHSLIRHVQHGWSFLSTELGDFIDLLPARQQIDDTTWYRGTADAIYQNIEIIKEHYRPKHVLILAGDHIYKMDYRKMLIDHIESGLKCTVSCIEVPKEEASGFGVMAVDKNLHVTGFVEKPEHPPEMPDKPGMALASMGIYVFDIDYLCEKLHECVAKEDTSHDFGNDIIPRTVRDRQLYAHSFDKSCEGRNPHGTSYWKDVGTLDSYWSANMDLLSESPQLDLFDEKWLIRGLPSQVNPSKFYYTDPDCQGMTNSIISGSCVIKDATITGSVLFDHITVDAGSVIKECVILPENNIGKNCVLSKCILDRHLTIPDGIQIGVDPEQDKKRFRVSEEGVILVNAAMLAKL